MIWGILKAKKIIKQCVIIITSILGLISNAYALDAPDILAPSDLATGETFYVMFVMSDAQAAALGNNYNTIGSSAEIDADAVTAAAAGSRTSGITGWRALYAFVGGHNTMDASQAWGNVTDRPIYTTTGTRIANDRAALLNTAAVPLLTAPDIDENGNTFSSSNYVHTGLTATGSASADPLGSGGLGATVGEPSELDSNWVDIGLHSNSPNRSLYVLSPLLTVPERKEDIPNAKKTQQTIGSHLANHVKNLTSQSIGLAGLITGTGFGEQGVSGLLGSTEQAAGFVENAIGHISPFSLQLNNHHNQSAGTFAFSTNALSNWYHRLDTINLNNSKQTIPSYEDAPRNTAVNLWMKGRWNQIKDERSDLNSKSDFGVMYIGGDFRYNDKTRIGLIGQLDWFEEKSATRNSSGKGQGGMIGPYLVSDLDEGLIFDVRASIGKSNNKISPIGTYTDSYKTNRWLFESNLTGWWKTENWDIQPSIGVNYFDERQQAYTDSNGQYIAAQSFSAGNLNLGPKIHYNISNKSGMMIRPMVGLKGIWQFKAPLTYSANGNTISNEYLSAQAETGISITLPSNAKWTANYSYDGIGVSNYHGHGIELGFSTPLSSIDLPNSSMKVSYSHSNSGDLDFSKNASQNLRYDFVFPF